jgi:ribonuclease HI
MRELFFLLICLICTSNGNADRIHLKDGSVVVSDKVWHSHNHVHFILKGTKNVEIRYAKEIVVKIESHSGSSDAPEIRKPGPTSLPQMTVSSDMPADKARQADENAVPGAQTVQPSQADVRVDERLVSSTRGLSFYDPRRAKRYWASRNSRHDTLDGVLQALSRQYGRTPKWVASHMGEENNLSEIHANLLHRRDLETLHKSGQIVGQAVAGKSADVTPPIGTAADAGSDLEAESYAGLEFYHPRRKQKYWTGKMQQYNTLQEALQALAKQYGVSARWIESNMGETNDLDAIHRNIRERLK